MNTVRYEEIRNNESMLRIRDYGNRKFTHTGLKEALIDVQNSMMSLVFEESHAQNLTYKDLYNYLDSAANDYQLKYDVRYNRLMKYLQLIRCNISTLISGEAGENRVSKKLKLLEMDGAIVLSNITLEDDEYGVTEIDNVVIDCNGVHAIEVKNLKGDIEITFDGHLKERFSKKYDYPVAAKMQAKEYLIRRIIKDAGISSNIGFDNMLVFADDGAEVTDDYHYVHYCHIGKLIDILRNKQEPIFNYDTMQQIAEVLKAADTPLRYKFDAVDFETLVDDFAYVLCSIEEKSQCDEAQINENTDANAADAAKEMLTDETGSNTDHSQETNRIFKKVLKGLGYVAVACIGGVVGIGAFILSEG